jgi:tRNA threonylcarbamoyladenosine biosynthesis protein TsaB
MSLILCIDTSQSDAGIYLGEEGKLVDFSLNGNMQDHASWIHVAIAELLKRQKRTVTELSAIAVIEGPGSYTGLRVGMATAKGLCYALQIPLITESSLKAMAASLLIDKEFISATISANTTANDFLLAPMIDARRMEVFTAVYDTDLNVDLIPQSLILDLNSFSQQLNKSKIFFFGSGSSKWKNICNHSSANFVSTIMSGLAIVSLCYDKFLNKEFAILTYSEPVYLKEFYIHHK